MTSRTDRESLMVDVAMSSALANDEQLAAGLSSLGSPGLFVPSEPHRPCPLRPGRSQGLASSASFLNET